MAGRRTKEVTSLIESESWRLRTEKMLTHQAITDEINRRYLPDAPIDRSTVSKALKRVEKRVLDEAEETVARLKVEHTATLEHAAAELLVAFEESKQNAKKAISNRRITAGARKPP